MGWTPQYFGFFLELGFNRFRDLIGFMTLKHHKSY